MAIKANTSSFGADLIHYASLSAEAESGPLYFVLAHHEELSSVQAKLLYAQELGEKVRPTILKHFKETERGSELDLEYAELVTTKPKTEQQSARQATILAIFNKVNTDMGRYLSTLKGVQKLRAMDRTVTIVKQRSATDIATNKYECYVISNETNEDGTKKEFTNVQFTATQLQRLSEAPSFDHAAMSTTDIRKQVVKASVPNVEKGNVSAIPRADIGKVVKQLDTSLSGTIIDGRLEGVSAATRKDVMLFWAHVDAMLSDAEKASARKQIADEAQDYVAKPKAAKKAKAA